MDGEGEVLKDGLRPSSEKQFLGGIKPIAMMLNWRMEAAKPKAKKQAKYNAQLAAAIVEPKESEFEDLKKIAKKSGVNKEVKKAFAELLETWPARKAWDEAQKARAEAQANRDRAAWNAAGEALNEKMYAVYKQGVRVQNTGAEFYVDFWLGVAETAAEKKEKKLGLAALDLLEDYFEGNSGALDYLKKVRDRF